MKIVLTITFCIFFTLIGICQEVKKNTYSAGEFNLKFSFLKEDGSKIYTKVKTYSECEYPGGIKALSKFLNARLKEKNLTWPNPDIGYFYLTANLVIDKDGVVKSATTFVKSYDDYDKIFLEVLKSTTGWIPATLDEVKVGQKIRLKLPVKQSIQ